MELSIGLAPWYLIIGSLGVYVFYCIGEAEEFFHEGFIATAIGSVIGFFALSSFLQFLFAIVLGVPIPHFSQQIEGSSYRNIAVSKDFCKENVDMYVILSEKYGTVDSCYDVDSDEREACDWGKSIHKFIQKDCPYVQRDCAKKIVRKWTASQDDYEDSSIRKWREGYGIYLEELESAEKIELEQVQKDQERYKRMLCENPRNGSVRADFLSTSQKRVRLDPNYSEENMDREIDFCTK